MRTASTLRPGLAAAAALTLLAGCKNQDGYRADDSSRSDSPSYVREATTSYPLRTVQRSGIYHHDQPRRTDDPFWDDGISATRTNLSTDHTGHAHTQYRSTRTSDR